MSAFYQVADFPQLQKLSANWRLFRDEYVALNAPIMQVDRVNKRPDYGFGEDAEYLAQGHQGVRPDQQNPHTSWPRHDHPELAREGLLQFRLPLKTADTRNDNDRHANSEFRPHVGGEPIVLNESDEERVMLLTDFRVVVAAARLRPAP